MAAQMAPEIFKYPLAQDARRRICSFLDGILMGVALKPDSGSGQPFVFVKQPCA